MTAMRKTVMEHYRRQLVWCRNRIQGEVEDLVDEALKPGEEVSGEGGHVPIHVVPLGTDTYEQNITFRLLENEQLTLEEIAAALERIDHGLFGRCEECRKAISLGRLDALPYTRYCIGCARKFQ